jgi:CheY-like chemotaxis protein
MESQLLILIVDEREESARRLRQRILQAGYCAECAGTVGDAIAHIERDQPDLIVAVDRAGESLVRALQASGADPCPIVFLGERESQKSSPLIERYLPQSIDDSQLLSVFRDLCPLPGARPETD